MCRMVSSFRDGPAEQHARPTTIVFGSADWGRHDGDLRRSRKM